MSLFDLTGHGALVTGSTQGIGLALAYGLEGQGAAVVRHGLETQGNSGLCLEGDLRQAGVAEDLVEKAFEAVPQLDILVCNAGRYFDREFLEMTGEAFDDTMALNLRAPYFMAQRFARKLLEKDRSGSIIFVASTNGIQAELDSSAYDTSKGGIIMMARTLAVALAPYQIRVNCLAPGLVRTPQTERWLGSNQQKREHYEKTIPLGRIGNVADCVGAVVYLASSSAGFVTGQTLVVDGGLTSLQIGPE